MTDVEFDEDEIEVYLLKGEETFGPFDESEIRSMLDQGLVGSKDICLPLGEDRPCRIVEVFGLGMASRSPADTILAAGDVVRDAVPPFRPAAAEDGSPAAMPINPIAASVAHVGATKRPSHGSVSPASPSVPPSNAVLFRGSPAFISFPKSLMAGILILIAGIYFAADSSWFLLIGLLGFAACYSYILMERTCNTYSVTSTRAEIVYGIFSKSSREVKIDDIRAINVNTRGLLGMIGVGNVEFCSAGSEGVEVVFQNIWKPHRVKSMVRRLQDQQKP